MEESSKPNTVATGAQRQTQAVITEIIMKALPKSSSPVRHGRQVTCEATSRATLHRSVPPVHELTSYSIRYKPDKAISPYQKSAQNTTSYLPNSQEKLLQNRKLLAKVVGIDASVFEHHPKQHASHAHQSNIRLNLDGNITRYSNAFSSCRSPRGLRSTWKELELGRTEILVGQGLPATPRLMRGNTKNYGIRRQISSNNQLELSPDFKQEDPGLHFNTPTDTKAPSPTRSPVKSDIQDMTPKHMENVQEVEDQKQFSIGAEVTQRAISNGLLVRDRTRDSPWVYCYKIKRDRLKLSELLASKSIIDSTYDDLLPAF